LSKPAAARSIIGPTESDKAKSKKENRKVLPTFEVASFLSLSLKTNPMTNVDLSRVPEYFHKYINLAADDDLDTAFEKLQTELVSFLKGIPKKKWNYRYAEGKWTVKEVVQHIIDADRVFAYRALCFARKDQTPLPPFDENIFAANSKADSRSKKELLRELKAVQEGSALLFRSFDTEQLEQPGVASGKPTYVKGIGYILVGHAWHHKKVLEERYLQ
jgi:uncharacterized damage-inducible protein DinB